MTAWEAGQCLIDAADALCDDEVGLRRGGYAELADLLVEMRLTIGDKFNALGSHDFKLPSHGVKP